MSLIQFASKIRNSLNKIGDYGFAPPVLKGDNIPKIIHQCFDSNNITSEIKENILLLKSMNPDWEYRFYDDSDMEAYIHKYFPDLYPYFLKIDPAYMAARVDFFRYLLIYNEGGVYLDIKSSITKPLDEIIQENDKYLLSYWPNERDQAYANTGLHDCLPNQHGEFQQWHIIAVKGHPFLKAVIDNVCNNIKIYNPFIHHTGRWGVIRVTGPIAYTHAINPLLNEQPHRLVRSHYNLDLTYSIFSHNQIPAHHAIFKKKHYSQFNLPVIRQSPLVHRTFMLLQPVKDKLITFSKKLR